MRAIAEWVSEIPLVLQKQKTIAGNIEWAEVDKHPLRDLLARPNPDTPFPELLSRWVLSMLSTGNGYMLYTPEDKELWNCKSNFVKVKANEFGQITGYHIANRGQSFDLESAQVIHVKLANPTGDYYGVPPSQVVRNTILTRLYLSGYIKNFFLNNALMGSVFSTDQMLGDPEKEKLRKEIKRLYGGAGKAFNTAIFDQGAKLDRISHNIKDLMPDVLYKIMREEIIAAYGLTHIMISVMDDMSYANAKIARRVFIENRGLPTLRLLESVLNLQLTSQFGNDIRLHFDRTKIPALQEDENEKSKRIVEQYRTSLITLNEGREQLGYEPDPEGDEYYSGPTMVGLGMATGGEGGDKGGGTPGLGVAHLSRFDSKQDNTDNPRSIRWKLHDKKVISLEKRFVRLMNRYFDSQLDRVLESLDEYTSSGKLMSRLGLLLKVDLPDDKPEHIFKIDAEDAALAEATGPLIKQSVRDAGRAAVNEINVRLSFNIDNPEVQVMISRFENRMGNVNKTTYAEIKKILKEGYDEGVGIDEVERRIRDKYKQFNKVRSTRIAKTEMNGMVNGGAVEGHKQAGVTHKEWMSAFLDTSRQWHMDADGSVVRIDEAFQIGSSRMMYPGDPNGSVEDVVNCHCTYTAVIREEQHGRNLDDDNGHRGDRLITTCEIHNP
jgi:HK97 family phage portal protein